MTVSAACHANHRDALRVAENLGGVRAQRSRAGDADDAVDHQIGRRVDAVDDPPTGFAERGQPFLVGAFRLEQYRVGSRTATAGL